jgi:hypothetical protein
VKKTAEEKVIFHCQSANVALNADCTQIVHFEAAKGFSMIIFLGRLVFFIYGQKQNLIFLKPIFSKKNFFYCTRCFFLEK